jgi:hypothetical protein
MAVKPSFADRAAYGGTRDIVAQGSTIVVRHHHDWSRVPMTNEGWRMKYSAATPLGVDEEVSNLKIYSSEGAVIDQVPSPPLTYLEISDDDRYVIGLSNIKHLNSTQLVVFDSKGELLLRRRISAQVFCFDVAGYQALKNKHREAFEDLARYSQQTYESYGWRDGDRVYLDIRGGIREQYWAPLWDEVFPALCDSPLSPNFGESVTNSIRWYHSFDPRPRVVESDGRPLEIRLRDPEGIEFAVKFDLTPLDSDQASQ